MYIYIYKYVYMADKKLVPSKRVNLAKKRFGFALRAIFDHLTQHTSVGGRFHHEKGFENQRV